VLALILLLWSASQVSAQTTAFTYRGNLSDGANPAKGNYDFQFKHFDTVIVGTGVQHGSTVSVPNITVTGGLFAVALDFGVCANCFSGANRFLEISVKPTSAGDER
jgi:hypothetical protein